MSRVRSLQVDAAFEGLRDRRFGLYGSPRKPHVVNLDAWRQQSWNGFQSDDNPIIPPFIPV